MACWHKQEGAQGDWLGFSQEVVDYRGREGVCGYKNVPERQTFGGIGGWWEEARRDYEVKWRMESNIWYNLSGINGHIVRELASLRACNKNIYPLASWIIVRCSINKYDQTCVTEHCIIGTERQNVYENLIGEKHFDWNDRLCCVWRPVIVSLNRQR